MLVNRWAGSVLAVVVAVLAGIGIIAPGAGLLAAMIGLPMFAAMIAFVALTARYAKPAQDQSRRATGVAARAAGIAAIGVSALGGLTDLVGPAAGPLVVVIGLVTALWAWSTVRHRVDHWVTLIMVHRRRAADPDRRQHEGPAT